jgi:hypothetical protein
MNQPTFTLDMTMMFAVHDALRRDLDHIALMRHRTEGWSLFETLLHVHHTTEDESLWPVLRQELTDQPDDLALLDAMEAEHAALGPVLDSVDAVFADGDAGSARLSELTGELDTVLRGHLQHEEDEALALIDATLTEEQWMGFGQASQQALGPNMPRFLPWVLDGASTETTERVLGLIPEPVQQAYGNEWRPAYAALDRWATKSSVA